MKLDIVGQQAVFPAEVNELFIVEARRSLELAISASTGKEFKIDLSKVASVSSAFLSMLLRVAASAESSRCQLSIQGIPEPMLNMAKVYGVDEVLPLG